MVQDAALAPEGGLVFVADYLTGRLLLWDQIASLQEAVWDYWDYPTSVALSSSLSLLASGYSSGGLAEQPIIAIWDRRTQETTQVITGFGTMSDLVFSPDGTQLAVADGGVSLYDVSNGTRTGQLDFDPTFSPAIAIAFSPDGSLLTAGHYDGSVTTWDATSLNQMADQQALEAEAFADRPISAIAFTPDAHLLAAASPDGAQIAILSPLGTTTPTLIELGHPVYSLAFSPDGEMLAAGGDSEITIWHAKDHVLLCRLVTDATSIVAVGFTPDGTSVLSASMEGTISEWSLDDFCTPA